MVEEEIWEPLEYDGVYYGDTYLISNFGRLKNIKTGHIRKYSKDKDGYLSFRITKDGKRKAIRVHRAVAETFNDGDYTLTVNHKDGNKENNRADNLEFISVIDNIKHAVINGLYHHTVDVEDIKKIKQMKNDGLKNKDIAAVFNITKDAVKDILSGRRHVLVQKLNMC